MPQLQPHWLLRLFKLEHSKAAYVADYLLYGLAVLALLLYLALAAPRQQWLVIALYSVLGLLSWTAIEYALHRYLLHGIQPFKRWHLLHHQRPAALICTSTLLSAVLVVTLVFIPMLLLSDIWRACALMLGLLTGYQAYAITHHAIHHWQVDSAWLRRRKQWHARHHLTTEPICFGVTSGVWDSILGSRGQNQKIEKIQIQSPKETS